MYRSAGTSRAALLATCAVPVLVVVALADAPVRVACLVFAGLWVVLAWRFWSSGVVVSADRVQVVTVLATRSFRWDEIERFYVAPFMGYPFCAYLELKSGRSISAAAISTPQPASEQHRRQVQEQVDELNAQLRRRQRS